MEKNLIQRSPEWYSYRRSRLGASDSIALMGAAPNNWKNSTPYDIWTTKQSDYIEEEPNFYMKRGIELEEEALRLFEQETGFLMSPKVIESDKYPFIFASLDGLSIDGDVACEIKCPGEKDHLQVCFGGIPEKYYPQLQHQMEVAGLDTIYYVSYRPEYELEPLVIKEVKRDQNYVDKLIEVERKFYEQHILTGIPPENPKAIKTIDSEVWLNLSEEYKRLDRQEKEAQKRKEEIRDYLVQIAQSENAKGNGIILQKVERKGIINYQNIPEIKTIDLEKYRKPSTSYWQVKELNET